MAGNSKTVSSAQQACHGKLTTTVRRHLHSPTRKPIANHTRAAFSEAQAWLAVKPAPLILDSCCGTGDSSRYFAERFPDHKVIGIDQSARRLSKHVAVQQDNYLLLQAECENFWQLAAAARWSLARHFILYPNPWPKPRHLQRRIHGSGGFAELLALGGQIEVRSNWRIYIEEFGVALAVAGVAATTAQLSEDKALSLFEQKYRTSGHSLWCLRANLSRD